MRGRRRRMMRLRWMQQPPIASASQLQHRLYQLTKPFCRRRSKCSSIQRSVDVEGFRFFVFCFRCFSSLAFRLFLSRVFPALFETLRCCCCCCFGLFIAVTFYFRYYFRKLCAVRLYCVVVAFVLVAHSRTHTNSLTHIHTVSVFFLLNLLLLVLFNRLLAFYYYAFYAGQL